MSHTGLAALDIGIVVAWIVWQIVVVGWGDS